MIHKERSRFEIRDLTLVASPKKNGPSLGQFSQKTIHFVGIESGKKNTFLVFQALIIRNCHVFQGRNAILPCSLSRTAFWVEDDSFRSFPALDRRASFHKLLSGTAVGVLPPQSATILFSGLQSFGRF